MAAPAVAEDEFDRNGFMILRSTLDQQEVASLRGFLTSALEKHHASPDAMSGIQVESTGCDAIWPDFYQHHPEWFRVFCNERIVKTLHRLLGYPFVLTRDSIVHWGYFPDWHTDTTTSEVNGRLAHKSEAWRMLTVGIYLQSGGALSVIPGSHRHPDPFVEMRKNRRMPDAYAGWRAEAVHDIVLDAGDTVIFDMRLIHQALKAATRTPSGDACQKIALFSRVSRNIPEHVATYTDFTYNGAGSSEHHLSVLREMACDRGFIAV